MAGHLDHTVRDMARRKSSPTGSNVLAGAAPRPRVEAALVPDPAVDFEHALPMVEHVAGERPRERILIVGIDVDLHDSERDRVRKLTLAGPAAAMEHTGSGRWGYAAASSC